MTSCRPGALLFAATLITSGSLQAADLSSLLRLAPDETNALAVVRVDRLHASPLGQQEKWAQQHAMNFMSGTAHVPPWAKVVVRASHFKPGVEGGEWNIGLVTHAQDIKLGSARRASGGVDAIDGHPAVVARDLHGYYVEVQPRSASQDGVLAVLSPATRQDVARWLKEGEQAQAPTVSEFLRRSAEQTEPDVMMALDMHQMIDPQDVRARLLFTSGLSSDSDAIEKLVQLIGGLRGSRFEVRVTETMQGRLTLEFSQEIGPEGKHLKRIVQDVMNDAYAALDEFADAKESIDGASISFEMPITDSTLRRIFSLIGDLPLEPPTVEAGSKSRVEQSDADQTLRYFGVVDRYVMDVRKTYQAKRPSYLKIAHWHKTYAERIRKLRTAGVDPVVVTYAQNIADSLEALSESLRGVGIDVNQLERRVRYRAVPDSTIVTAYVWPGVAQPVSWAETVRVESNLKQVRAAQAKSANETASDRDEIWKFIDEQRATVTDYLSDRYDYEP